ncbi:hypothetical protein ACFXGE_26555, partial [Streptomyces sp. NPDC059378]
MPVDPYDDRSGVPAGDPFEDRLSAALQETGGTFDTDRAALAAGGAARGRRRQLLRRTAVVGSVAGIALVGVGSALLVPWGGTSATQPSSVATQPRPAGSKSASSSAAWGGWGSCGERARLTQPTPLDPARARGRGRRAAGRAPAGRRG